ncbi:hypothetical protein Avbf_01637 [Armadillidium vulgare]|nr:hypothetical protein Avbf_01637 [Armadillidium vulgare]
MEISVGRMPILLLQLTINHFPMFLKEQEKNHLFHTWS